MKIVCLDGSTLNPGDNPWAPVEALGEFTVYDKTTPAQVLDRAAGAEVILTNKTLLGAEVIAQLPNLKLIAVLATGYNVVDVVAARQAGVAVANVPVYSTDTVAQFAFALLLELCHHTGEHNRAVQAGRWENCDQFCFWDSPLVELSGKTLGLVGFGRIGQRTGEIARAFGMNVIAYTRSRSAEASYPFSWAASLDELFATADVISLHCPQTDENTGFINAALLAKAKPSAFLINTARGGILNEADLAAALNAGQLAGAACDVVSAEPILGANPLLGAKNCILTPHIAWATLEARMRLTATTAENIAAYQAGEPINVVN